VTPREIVQRTITFRHPERIALALPEPYPDDTIWRGVTADPSWRPSRTFRREEGRKWEDEWGNVWAATTDFYQGEVIEGALQDWSQLDSYRMPTFDDPARYRQAAAAFAKTPERYHIGGLPGFPFSIMRYLRRMDIFLADLLLNPKEVDRLAEQVIGLLCRCVVNWAGAGADAIMFAEDWGTQDRLLVSPAMWRRIFKPYFLTLCGHARARGLSVWMHSCGYIYDIIADLIECGVAVLQFDQPGLYGVDRLAAEFGGRVTFYCPVDIQRILPTGDIPRIEAFARELVEKLGARGGGFIAGYYGSMEGIGVRPEWQDAACRAFVKCAGLHAGSTLA
jgi:uroporphyrinogen decarboxylase